MNVPRILILVILSTFSFNYLLAENNQSSKKTDNIKESKVGFGLQAEIFAQVRDTVSSQDISRNLSVFNSYNLIPGDVFELNITLPNGTTYSSTTYNIQIQEDYNIEIPFVGKLNANGLSVIELQNLVTKKVRAAVLPQYVSFLLKNLAQFNVFIYGGVEKPGYIVATSLVRVIDAIATAGGFKDRASYRKIHLIRDGKSIPLDISKFYAAADETMNPFLKSGDSIYVPYASIITTISGQTKFTGTYELIQNETLKDLLLLAGDLKPEALPDSIEVLRIGSDGKQVVKNISYEKAAEFKIIDGDTVTVRSIFDNNATITIEGAIYGDRTSGKTILTAPTEPKRLEIAYYPGMTVLAALEAVGGITPFAESDRCVLTRKADGKTEKINIADLWRTRSRAFDTELNPGDSVVIPASKQLVFVTGAVDSPGAFSYIKGYTINDYLLKAGGITYNTGDPDGVYLVDDEGNKTKLKRNSLAAPGININIEKKVLFETDTLFSNVLIFTGFMTTILYAIDTAYNFRDRIKARF